MSAGTAPTGQPAGPTGQQPSGAPPRPPAGGPPGGAPPGGAPPGQPPGSPPSGPPPTDEPPGLRSQGRATFDAAKRLIGAHIDLAKAELGEIVDEVKRMVALGALAFAAFVLMAMFLSLGLALFLGEWLFGSLGWGVLLGAALTFDLAMLALLLALDVPGRKVGTAFLIAAAIGIVVGVVFGLGLARRGWETVGEGVLPSLEEGPRPVAVAVIVIPIIIGIIGFILGLRGKGRPVQNLVTGIVVGAFLGLLTSISLPSNAGAAIGVLVILVAWPIIAGRDVIRTGVDTEALARKFTPEATIEITKETIEWVRARTPLVPKS
jgi:hypothetical protein